MSETLERSADENAVARLNDGLMNPNAMYSLWAAEPNDQFKHYLVF